MATKFSTIFAAPKSDDITFKPDLSANDFSECAEFAPGQFVYFEKDKSGKKEPITKVAKGDDYIEYGMDCPFKSGCIETIGDKEKPQPHVCKKTCDKFEISLESKHHQVEEIITLNIQPDSNEFTFLVDSNLDYEMMYPVEDLENPALEPLDTPDILGYHGVNHKSGSEVIFYWDVLKIKDRAGMVTFALYHAPLDGKNIRFTIGQAWLDNATYPIFIGGN